jgi:hypothetical protein
MRLDPPPLLAFCRVELHAALRRANDDPGTDLDRRGDFLVLVADDVNHLDPACVKIDFAETFAHD